MPLFDYVGGVIINQSVGTRAYEDLRSELKEQMVKIVDPNSDRRVVSEVFRREEIYEGVFVENAPDLIVILDEHYVGDRSLLTNDHFGKTAATSRQWVGTHRSNGILLMDGTPIRSGVRLEGAGIADIAPTVLHLLGLSTPAEMDGNVLEDSLEARYREACPVAVAEGRYEQCNPGEGWGSPEEESQVRERLRQLGYLQ